MVNFKIISTMMDIKIYTIMIYRKKLLIRCNKLKNRKIRVLLCMRLWMLGRWPIRARILMRLLINRPLMLCCVLIIRILIRPRCWNRLVGFWKLGACILLYRMLHLKIGWNISGGKMLIFRLICKSWYGSLKMEANLCIMHTFAKIVNRKKDNSKDMEEKQK